MSARARAEVPPARFAVAGAPVGTAPSLRTRLGMRKLHLAHHESPSR